MAIKQETITLHDYGEFGANSAQANIRRRTTSKGTKDRVSFEIRAEPLVHMFDDTALGAGPAQAIRDKIEKDIKGIAEFAQESTREFRRYAQEAFRGKVGTKHTKSGRRRKQVSSAVSPTLRKRYSGGRIGFKEPNQTQRMFNDSGRLAEGIFVRQNTRAFNYAQNAQEVYWTVNVPANRFTEHTQHLVKELFRLVDSLNKPQKLMEDREVAREIRDSMDLLISKAESLRDVKRKQLALARKNAIRAALKLPGALAGF